MSFIVGVVVIGILVSGAGPLLVRAFCSLAFGCLLLTLMGVL